MAVGVKSSMLWKRKSALWNFTISFFQHWGVEHLKIVVWIQAFWPLAWCKCCPWLGLMGWMEYLYIFLRFVKHCRSSPRTSQSEHLGPGCMSGMDQMDGATFLPFSFTIAPRCRVSLQRRRLVIRCLSNEILQPSLFARLYNCKTYWAECQNNKSWQAAAKY